MAFNYISFIVAKQTQTIQSLFFFVIIQSLASFCSHSVINQPLLPGQWINSSHKTAKTQLLNYMESRIPHAKLGFATTAKCSTPTGKQSTKLHKKTRTMKRSFSMTSGDRTIIFTLSLLGLSSKHNQYPSNQIQYSRNPKKKL